MKHEFYIQVINCSLKFLSESSKLCEVNVIGKNAWFIQFFSFTIFTKLEALLDNFKSNYFLDKGETIEVRFYKQIDGSQYKVFEAFNSR